MGVGAAVTTAVVLVLRLSPPELLFSHTFSASDTNGLPENCRETAERLYGCQKTGKRRWVLACHRKWCLSRGHCEPCAGIGDRTRFMLSQVQDATDKCMKVELDYTLTDMAILDTAVYTDPKGWLAELFRFRSYKVSDRRSPDSLMLHTKPEDPIFTHFTPNEYYVHHYDPCYFHSLFRPAPLLKKDLDFHNRAIGSPSIGIHYRTGDSISFGVDNHDNRIAPDKLELGLRKMLHCANQLANRLFKRSKDRVTFYLATDNPLVKDMIHDPKINGGQKVYTTDVQPRSFLRGLSGDRDAWMEMYLLAARQGLVVNVAPKDYGGPAGRLSYFSELAKKVGFLSDTQLLECEVDH